MKQLKLFDGEAAPKRKLTRKRIERAARKLVRDRDRAQIAKMKEYHKCLRSGWPRVIPKNPVRPRSAESEVGLRFVLPALRKELTNYVGWNNAAGMTAIEAEKQFFRDKRGTGFPKLVKPRPAPAPLCTGHGVVAVQEFKTFDQDIS